MQLLKFLGSTAGRWIRGIAGLVLASIGFGLGGGWVALGIVGIVVMVAGLFDFCIFAPLGGLPFNGKKFRAKAGVS
jgi:hypothetical protein